MPVFIRILIAIAGRSVGTAVMANLGISGVIITRDAGMADGSIAFLIPSNTTCDCLNGGIKWDIQLHSTDL